MYIAKLSFKKNSDLINVTFGLSEKWLDDNFYNKVWLASNADVIKKYLKVAWKMDSWCYDKYVDTEFEFYHKIYGVIRESSVVGSDIIGEYVMIKYAGTVL